MPLSESLPTAMSEFASDLLRKQPFPGYRLANCLASDSARAAFKADGLNLNHSVAVKALRPWPGREGTAEEFFSLAGSIARLHVPGAARGLDTGRGGGAFFLVYEFIPGESLAARLARRQSGRLTEKESLRLVAELARILQKLFDFGHPHGHLHPANIILGEGGKATLLDMGFAWTLAWPDDAAAFLAAPEHLPPERIAGELSVDIRGDLYSLGTIWHAVLLGEPVFRGRLPRETLTLHLEREPIPPREIDPRLSAATSGLILWLLSKDRGARPRTPKEFLRKLEAHPLLKSEEPPTAKPGC
ncbi:MAG: serine/threonine protein kinase [Planctomycetes bacterium]|nr:serine/threonine protein kinase [Planctomycetota bacterium]